MKFSKPRFRVVLVLVLFFLSAAGFYFKNSPPNASTEIEARPSESESKTEKSIPLTVSSANLTLEKKVVPPRKTASVDSEKEQKQEIKSEEPPVLNTNAKRLKKIEPESISSAAPVGETARPVENTEVKQTESARKVEPQVEPQGEKRIFTDDQKVWLVLGLGLNYLKYTQTVPGISDLQFQSLESPTIFVNVGSMVSEKSGMDLSYKTSPGSVKSSSTITILSEKYTWKTLTIEGLYQQEALQLRYGLQQHFVPFMTTNSNGDVLIREHNLTMLTGGFNYFLGYKKRVRHVLGLRYQYPLAQGSGGSEAFSITPKFAFDGQIGQEFFLTEKLFIGAYWYGQWHDYDFLFQNGTQTDSGRQSLFFSTIDLRIGFEF